MTARRWTNGGNGWSWWSRPLEAASGMSQGCLSMIRLVCELDLEQIFGQRCQAPNRFKSEPKAKHRLRVPNALTRLCGGLSKPKKPPNREKTVHFASRTARRLSWSGAGRRSGIVKRRHGRKMDGFLAGEEGFEPSNAGTKTRCLTTWRLPKKGGSFMQLHNRVRRTQRVNRKRRYYHILGRDLNRF